MATHEIVALLIMYFIGGIIAFMACITASVSRPLHFPWEKAESLRSMLDLMSRLVIWPVFFAVNTVYVFFGILSLMVIISVGSLFQKK